MTKSAAQKIINKISDNRKDALLKQAYEYGVYQHCRFSNVDEETSKLIAKKASVLMTKALEASEQRKSEVKKAILAKLGK
jgi:hypothetical protein